MASGLQEMASGKPPGFRVEYRKKDIPSGLLLAHCTLVRTRSEAEEANPQGVCFNKGRIDPTAKHEATHKHSSLLGVLSRRVLTFARLSVCPPFLFSLVGFQVSFHFPPINTYMPCDFGGRVVLTEQAKYF